MLFERAIRRAVALAALCCAACAGPAWAGSEAYFPLDRIKIAYETGNLYQRVLVVDVALATSTIEDKEKVRAIRHLIKAEIAKSLGETPVATFEAGNLAAIVKRLARVAAQRAAGTELRITDALIRSVRLL